MPLDPLLHLLHLFLLEYFVAILDQLQHMRAHIGSRLDHIFDEMCQMNTKIGHIACR